MFIYSACLKLTKDKYPRFVLFVLITAALTLGFALIGRDKLYSDIITEPISVIIVDHDKSMESQMFTQMFMDYEPYKNIIHFTTDTEENALIKIRANEAAAVLILPADFSEHIKDGTNEPFIVHLNDAQSLKSTLVKYFAEAFSDLLAASQSGVYAALSYTRLNYPESYNRTFTIANLKFIGLVLNRGDMFRVREYAAIDTIPTFLHYAVHIWLFLNFAAMILFFDILTKNFSRLTRAKLRVEKVCSVKFAAQLTLSVFTVFLMLNAPLFIAALKMFALPARLLVPVIPIILCISLLVVFCAFFFRDYAAACMLTSVFSVLGIFLAGGVVPREFFMPDIRPVSYFTLNYWMYESITTTYLGQGFAVLPVIGVSVLLFSGLCLFLARR